MMWNEYIYNGKTIRYTYNHAGERIVKSHGDLEGVYINGAPQGITFHEHDEFTLYPASIISVNKNRFTKHYFIGDKRIASRIGSGQFNNVYGRNGCYVTAGQQDYAERINQIEQQREEYYKELGIPPGVPTMKGAYGDPENTGVGYNTIITELGDHSVPKNWEQYIIKKGKGETPGPPIIWGEPQSPEEVEPGYGYVSDDTAEEETFFYHSDHLGSTSYITDQDGNITQYTAYLPYGELLVDEHSSSEELPYKFNGKELDEETGLYYYGARYLNPTSSVWYGVDQLTEKYSNVSGYACCLGNPIKFVDPDGQAVVKGAIAAFKYAKRIWKIYKKTGNLSRASLKKAGLEEIYDIAGDIVTIFSGDVSTFEKIGAATDLIIGTDLNNKGQKKIQKVLESTIGKEKGSLSETKKALKKVKDKLGLGKTESLPKQKGKFGSPSRGNSQKGYRLDPAHPNAKPGSGEEYPHINYWDFTKGKRNNGGISGAEPIKK